MDLVSIVLPVFNAAEFVEKSVQSLISQEYTNIEIIAINDGSTDKSGEILERLSRDDGRIRVYHQGNMGLGKTIRTGIEKAKGTYIARQDADDFSMPTRIMLQYNFMKSNLDVSLCGTWVVFFQGENEPVYIYQPPNDDNILRKMLNRRSNPLVHGSVMFKASDYSKTKEGMRDYLLGEDYDLWLSLAAIGKIGCIESFEYYYKINSDGVMSAYGSVGNKVKKIIKKTNNNHSSPDTTVLLNNIVKAGKQKGGCRDIDRTRKIICLINGEKKEHREIVLRGKSKHFDKIGLKGHLARLVVDNYYIGRLYYKIRTRNNNLKYLNAADKFVKSYS